MRTGVFFHPLFSEGDWPVIGNKFRNFREILKRFEGREDVVIVEPKEADDDLICKVHTRSYLDQVRRSWYFKGASLSVGATSMALQMIADGAIRNALVFSCAAGHHAEPSFGWGGTYLSCTGPAIYSMREKYGHVPFAIIDTDSHHGNGTRAIFRNDRSVLHVCFCSIDLVEGDGEKVDVDVGYRTTDEAYLNLVKKEFLPRLNTFRPFAIFHNFGHDTCQRDYGDRGLTPSFFLALAEEVKAYADKFCNGRYIIITHGGSRRDVAEYIFPEIIEILAKGAKDEHGR